MAETERPLRVLFVEDREDDALLVVRELKRGGYHTHVVRVESAEEMRHLLQTETWDLIISDYSLPNFSAVAALQIFKESGLDLPFLIVSGTVGEDIAVTALKGGAHDFIPKGNLKRLLPAVARELREAESRRERRSAEENLRATTDMLAAVFTASPVPMMLLDRRGCVLRWNRAAERVFGWQADELIGRPLPIVPESEREDHQQRVQRVLAGETISSVEAPRVCKDGSLLNLLISAAPIRGADGQISGVMDILVDVTEQRALEEQFRQAQKMEAVGRLAGGIAHDFNNVLTAIHGYGRLVLDDMPEDDSHRADIKEIVHAAERAASFTRQLLSFSRTHVLQAEHIDLNTMLAEMNKLLERLIGDNIELELELSSEPQFVFTDKGQLEQVVMNLVVNARDAVNDHGGGRVVLRTYAAVVEGEEAAQQGISPGRFSVLEVQDNGSGIAPETLARIFEPFFTTKDIGKGTGLGLSTVYGITRQNHGLVRVSSTPGAGSTFAAFFPENKRAAAGPVDEQPKEPGPRRGQGSILVVEDEPAIRNLVKRVLERAGYRVHTAADPHEALTLLPQLDFDILLTDMLLPHMSGQELAQLIQQQRPEIATLFMSGYTEDEMDVEAAYLEKPFTPEDLLQKLEQLRRPRRE